MKVYRGIVFQSLDFVDLFFDRPLKNSESFVGCVEKIRHIFVLG